MKQVSTIEFFRLISDYQRIAKLQSNTYADLYCVSVNWFDNQNDNEIQFRMVSNDEGETVFFVK